MTSITAVVVPCFNEETRLDPEAFVKFGSSWPGRFVFVDDGSSDGTVRVIEGLVAQLPAGSEVVRLDHNRGKAEAVRTGVLRAIDAGADIVAYWDSDLSTPLDVVPAFEAELARGDCDAVLGARVALMGRQIERRRARHYMGRGFATAASMTLGLTVYDTQCGAKMFRVTPEIRSVFAEPFRSRWIFDVEILARLVALAPDAANRIREWPLESWRDVSGSRLKPRDYVRAATDLWLIRRQLKRASVGAAGGGEF